MNILKTTFGVLAVIIVLLGASFGILWILQVITEDQAKDWFLRFSGVAIMLTMALAVSIGVSHYLSSRK